MRNKYVYIICVIAITVFSACSTTKNTALTRRVQSFKARYNTYFNAHQSFLEGIEAQRTGNKDNYTELIPLFMTANKGTESLGKANFDKTIEKCKKTIKQHSITARPKVSGNGRRTQKEKIWLTQKEYNPFLYKAWFLMGEAQFHKGEYMEAAATFAYIQRQYFSKPNIIAKARILEAKCYAELKWYYDAENLLARAKRDSIPEKLLPLHDAILADCQIGQEQYREAIPNLKNAIKIAQGSYQKARMYFLLGQLYHLVGENENAYNAYKKVIAKNPPYELAFNARIQMTEVMSQGQSKQMIRKLTSMAKNPKNKDYLDQVYYAIGNIHMANNDTLHAIWAYKDGVEKSTRSGVDKGVVWLHLGQLYWEREEFTKAKDCYAGALGLFDKERPDYKEIDRRTKILEELYPYASAVELQDSLQTLARMDSVERMKVIDKIIEEVNKKEKEEARKAAEANSANNNNNLNNQNNQNNRNNNANNQQGNRQTGGVWYFYNPTAVNAGKAEFQRKWGNRQLTDDWRRSNRTVLADERPQENQDAGQQGDNQGQPGGDQQNAQGQAGQDGQGGQGGEEPKEMTEEEKKQQEYKNDPHRPEYYLKDIPLTDEQMEASNAALVEGLYNSAIIYKDRMENFPLAERTFKRVMEDFPEYEHMDETYYNMFQLYARQDMRADAEEYKDKLLAEFPENEHGKLISDPMFEYKGRYGKAIEDSIYKVAYDDYQNGQFQKVIRNSQYTLQEYPNGENRARFMFIEAMSHLELGNRNEFLKLLKEVVEKYPKSTVSELSGLYVKGVNEGRILASGRMEMGTLWDRRAGFLIDGDSTLSDTIFTDDREEIHMFVIAYEHNSLNENQLLYEMAKYNFMNFPVRNFDINFEFGDGIDMLQIRPFLNYKEAYSYQRKMENDEEMAEKMEGLKWFVISDHNLKLVKRGLSFNDYFEFVDNTYKEENDSIFDENILNEPVEIAGGENTDEPADSLQNQNKPVQGEGDDNNIFGGLDDFDDEPANNNNNIYEGQGEFLDDTDNNNDNNNNNNIFEGQGEFLDDLDNDSTNNNNIIENQGQFLDDFDDNNNNDNNNQIENQGQFLDDLDNDNQNNQQQEDDQNNQNNQNQGTIDEWDGNIEDFDDEDDNNQNNQDDEWDGNVEDFDDDGNNNNNVIIDHSQEQYDDDDDEDYIF